MLLERLKDAQEAITAFMRNKTDKYLPIVMSYVEKPNASIFVGIDADDPLPLSKYLDRARDFTGDLPLQVARVSTTRTNGNTGSVRPVVGGIQICTSYRMGSVGTLCVVGELSGTLGLLVSGHVAGTTNRVIYQPTQSSANNIGKVKIVSSWRDGSADVAWAEYNTAVSPSPSRGRIWKSSSETYKVKGTKKSGSSSPGDAVSMQGINSSSKEDGKIAALDVTVKFKAGEFDPEQILTNQVLADYKTDSGDSGGPVFEIISGNDVNLLGINVGVATPSDVVKIGRGGPLNPSTNYGIYTPWEEITAALGAADVKSP